MKKVLLILSLFAFQASAIASDMKASEKVARKIVDLKFPKNQILSLIKRAMNEIILNMKVTNQGEYTPEKLNKAKKNLETWPKQILTSLNLNEIKKQKVQVLVDNNTLVSLLKILKNLKSDEGKKGISYELNKFFETIKVTIKEELIMMYKRGGIEIQFK